MDRSRKVRELSLLFIFLLLLSGCKKTPATPEASAPLQPTITVSCNPSSASTDTIVTVTISIKGNTKEVRAFGMDATFDAKMFQFQEAGKASLTGTWAAVDGEEVSSGSLRVGGFVGGGTPIPQNSNGVIAEIRLKVRGGDYGDGQQSQICLRNYTDDLAGFSPESVCATFTYKK